MCIERQDSKELTENSPAFFKDGFISEQIEGLKYAQGETVELKKEYVSDDIVYEPACAHPDPWKVRESDNRW